MSTKEIREALGIRSGASSRQVFNAAIRRWLVGGDDLLDSIELVNRLVSRLRDRGLAGAEESQEALDRLLEVRKLFENSVRAKTIHKE